MSSSPSLRPHFFLSPHLPSPQVNRAKELFDGAWTLSWDPVFGGLVYGFGPDRTWCDSDDAVTNAVHQHVRCRTLQLTWGGVWTGRCGLGGLGRGKGCHVRFWCVL